MARDILDNSMGAIIRIPGRDTQLPPPIISLSEMLRNPDFRNSLRLAKPHGSFPPTVSVAFVLKSPCTGQDEYGSYSDWNCESGSLTALRDGTLKTLPLETQKEYEFFRVYSNTFLGRSMRNL